jgi:glycosyltransferase involved in cell wall biosynthesis
MSDSKGMLLFRRDFHGLTGGHLKVWHYFRHALESRRFVPRVFLTPASERGPENPWCGDAEPALGTWNPAAAAAVFVAGLDWIDVPDPCPAPVINLVQGVRHATADDPRRRFLARRAVRICVSAEVADAIRGTGEVNGPVHVIPNALDLADLPPAPADRDIDVVVAGLKNPALARGVARELVAAGLRVECLMAPLPRPEFLAKLGRARVAVTLPLECEGFFLPALEAMAMGCLVVCPDCVGNRGFCRDGETAFRPAATLDALVAAARAAVAADPAAARALRSAAAAEVERHGLDRERRAFLAILDGV